MLHLWRLRFRDSLSLSHCHSANAVCFVVVSGTVSAALMLCAIWNRENPRFRVGGYFSRLNVLYLMIKSLNYWPIKWIKFRDLILWKEFWFLYSCCFAFSTHLVLNLLWNIENWLNFWEDSSCNQGPPLYYGISESKLASFETHYVWRVYLPELINVLFCSLVNIGSLECEKGLCSIVLDVKSPSSFHGTEAFQILFHLKVLCAKIVHHICTRCAHRFHLLPGSPHKIFEELFCLSLWDEFPSRLWQCVLETKERSVYFLFFECSNINAMENFEAQMSREECEN